MSGPELGRLSFNQITADHLSLAEVVEGCTTAGIPWVGAWRHKLEPGAGEMIRAAGLRVSSLCRGGFFFTESERERRERADDNKRAVDEAAELGTDVLVLVCGGARGPDLARARAAVTRGIEDLIPYAREHGIRLAIEPLHPMMVVERSVIVTLAQAVTLAERFDGDDVGVIVDAYHVWWDPELDASIARARGRILGYHVSDWLVPTTNLLAGRGMMGEGAIDLPRLRELVDAAGYDGPIEVEVINPDLKEIPGPELIARTRDAYLAHA